MNKEKALELYRKGCAKENKKEFEQALTLYKAAIKADKGCRPALLCLGVLYSHMGKAKTALAYLLQAHQIQSDAILCFNLGSEYFKLLDYENCNKYLQQCLDFNNDMLKAHLLLAHLYQKKGDLKKTSLHYKEAHRIDAENRMASLGYAMVLTEQKNYTRALATLEMYLKRSKSDISAQRLRAKLLLELGQVKKSYTFYTQLIKVDPQFTKFSDHLHTLRQEMNEEYKQMLTGVDDKIQKRVQRLKTSLIKQRKQEKLTQKKRATEGKKNASQKEKEFANRQQDLRDMVDLSLLHLFQGETEKAMQYLFHAKQHKSQFSKK